MFDSLLGQQAEFILTQSFAPVDRVKAGAKIRDARSIRKDAGDEAVTLTKELEKASDQIASRIMSLGRHHFTVAVLSNSPEQLEVDTSRVLSALSASEVRPRREDIGTELAWWAQLPGNMAYQARSASRYVSNMNFADMASFHTVPAGARYNLRWGGPITALRSSVGTAVYFSLHAEGDAGADNNAPGNTAVFGPPGTGKTLWVNMMLAQSARLPTPPDVIYFDMHRGSESFIRAMGGSYLRLTPGQSLGFNPFEVATDEDGQEWLKGFVARLTGSDELSTEQKRRIEEAVRRNAQADPELRTFRDFSEFFRSTDDRAERYQLRDTLSVWHSDGGKAWLFDNERDSFSLDDRYTGFDMTEIVKFPELLSATLDYLFFRIERALTRGHPCIIVLEEAWELVDHPMFEARIRQWIKTIRKQNGVVIFTTQEPADAAQSGISTALIQSVQQKIFFSNADADRESYCDAFGLSNAEYELVRGLPQTSRAALFKVSQSAVLASTRIDGARPFLKVLSGTAESVREMDALRDKLGDERWLAAFMADPDPQKKEHQS